MQRMPNAPTTNHQILTFYRYRCLVTTIPKGEWPWAAMMSAKNAKTLVAQDQSKMEELVQVQRNNRMQRYN